jgi:hypothetical protein
MRIHPLAVLLAISLLDAAASPASAQYIHPDSRVVIATRVRPDGATAARQRPVCDTLASAGATRMNDERFMLDQLLGGVTRLEVAGVSADWRDTAQVHLAVSRTLASRPRRLTRGPNWRESSWSPEFRITGRVHYENGHVGRFQLAHFVHVCIEDAQGRDRWFRLLPGELWFDGPPQQDEGTYELQGDRPGQRPMPDSTAQDFSGDHPGQGRLPEETPRPVSIGSFAGPVQAGVEVSGELGGAGPENRGPRIHYRDYAYQARAGEHFTVVVSSSAFRPYVQIGIGEGSGREGFVALGTVSGGKARTPTAEHTSLRDFVYTIRVGSIVDEQAGPFTLRIERQR